MSSHLPSEPSSLKRSVREWVDGAAPLLDRAGHRLDSLTRNGLDVVRHRARRMHDQTLHASDCTLHYIRGEPVKAVLIAAATGAALIALVTVFAPARRRG